MKRLALILAAIAMTGMVERASAQRPQWYGAITYEVSVGQGDTKQFVNEEIAWRGMGLNFRYLTNPNMTVGLYFGWHAFYERAFREIELDQAGVPGTVSGSQDRYLNSFPMMLNAHYYLGGRGDIRPYFGLNAGGYIFAQRIGLGVFTLHEDRWDWGIAPEVGLFVPTSRHTGMLVNARYQYAFTGEIFGFDAMHEYWGFSIGFVWDEQ